MLKLLQLLEPKLLNNITALDKYRPISKIADLEPGNQGFSGYAICAEILKDRKYKGRKGKNETSLFLNCYSNVSNNSDLAVLWLMSEVKKTLDEANLSDASLGIKTYKVEYDDSSPTPQFNARLQAWQSVITVTIRWEEI